MPPHAAPTIPLQPQHSSHHNDGGTLVKFRSEQCIIGAACYDEKWNCMCWHSHDPVPHSLTPDLAHWEWPFVNTESSLAVVWREMKQRETWVVLVISLTNILKNGPFYAHRKKNHHCRLVGHVPGCLDIYSINWTFGILEGGWFDCISVISLKRYFVVLVALFKLDPT